MASWSKNVIWFLCVVFFTSSCSFGSSQEAVGNTNLQSDTQSPLDFDRFKVENYLNAGDLEKALTMLEKAYKQEPSNIDVVTSYAQALTYIGSTQYKEEEYASSAITILQEYISNDPSNTEIRRLLGYAYEILELYDYALSSYDVALQLNPDYPMLLTNVGHVYKLQGNWEKSAEYFKNALEIDSEFDYALLNVANYYLYTGDINQAKQYYNRTIANTDNQRYKSEAYYSLGSLELLDKNPQSALDKFELSNESDPKFDLPYIGLARAQFMLAIQNSLSGNQDTVNQDLMNESFDNLAQAIEINPNKVLSYYQLALHYNILGDIQTAKKFFVKSLEVLPFDITLSTDEKEALKKQIQNLLLSFNS